MKIQEIKERTEKEYGALEKEKFYDISRFGYSIETPNGWVNVKSFVVKEGFHSRVVLGNGSVVNCSDRHFITTVNGSYMVRDLQPNDLVVTKQGNATIEEIQIFKEIGEFYDLEVDSEDGLYYTADGVCHHNTGKTQTVEDMLHAAGKSDGEGYFKITGSATPVGIYRILYNHRRDIVLFDDSDSALNDQEGRNLFKAASDTKKVRKISWMKGGKNFVDPQDFDEDNDDELLPRYFEFTGKIIFISNLPLNKLDPDGALRTRGYVINVDPTNEEIYDFMLKIANKIPLDVDYPLGEKERLEVVEVLRTRKVGDKTANLRSLVRALNTRAGVELSGGSKEEWVKFVRMFA